MAKVYIRIEIRISRDSRSSLVAADNMNALCRMPAQKNQAEGWRNKSTHHVTKTGLEGTTEASESPLRLRKHNICTTNMEENVVCDVTL